MDRSEKRKSDSHSAQKRIEKSRLSNLDFQVRSVVDSEKYTGVAAIFHPASLENLFRVATIIASCGGVAQSSALGNCRYF